MESTDGFFSLISMRLGESGLGIFSFNSFKLFKEMDIQSKKDILYSKVRGGMNGFDSIGGEGVISFFFFSSSSSSLDFSSKLIID